MFYFCAVSSPFKPSRVDQIQFSEFGRELHIDMLRDDLIHPLVSGNKWRKLKFIIKDLESKNDPILTTFGGAYSNHLVACAYAGHHFGIKTHAFVRGDEKRELNAFEKTCLDFGMTLTHVNRSAYKDKVSLFQTFKTEFPQAYFVGEGGRHPLALTGCAEILNDLKVTYDYIFLALGTGTTMEGLVKAVSEKKLKTRVIGVSSLKNNLELDQILSAYPKEYWQIEHNYHRGKYAKNDQELKNFIDHFKVETDVQLEFVYTGKMMLALKDMIQKKVFKNGDRILCIHTGGLPHLL